MISGKAPKCSSGLLVSYMPLAAIFARRFFAARRVLVRYIALSTAIASLITSLLLRDNAQLASVLAEA